MLYSPEAMEAFAAAAALGSFSAAARQLGKSQSTISTAIANLEADLDLTLFDRSSRLPVLTTAGRRVLAHVQEILAAGDRLEALSLRLSDKVEPRLTIVLSDTYGQSDHLELMQEFEQRYRDIELECLIAEGPDVIDLLQSGRAHLAVTAAAPSYPAGIASARLAQPTRMGVFVARTHPLVAIGSPGAEHLAATRQIYLNSYIGGGARPLGLAWSAPSYLMLLELTQQGFGWAELPDWLVRQYAGDTLSELLPRGWPRLLPVDVLWSRMSPPGPAGQWLLDSLLSERRSGG
ncbi:MULTISPECIES: LysR family transcriptional regulator [unclassified Devosia]|uniref:LysR family transcriptional regulator n=1 Tax=unclassified Devosia TaxID=196773 RepID=UPI00086F7734|nr:MULTISPECIES: LysR family transcriptional regulator [unclassified Devosia]MBN9364149.1 LysR family transcriptional regulator [Devosia sp.]ODS81312.1 MAG: transcriptional regulator [Devosia sp. SCN 66-27]OJX27390.1 MAG: LysR family transcriptional regulator [Devosia sp. 66-14]